MAKFVQGKPQMTGTPTIDVDAGSLPMGSHRFRLQVVGASGKSSAADEVVIEVAERAPDPDRIIAALTATRSAPLTTSGGAASTSNTVSTSSKTRSKQ